MSNEDFDPQKIFGFAHATPKATPKVQHEYLRESTRPGVQFLNMATKSTTSEQPSNKQESAAPEKEVWHEWMERVLGIDREPKPSQREKRETVKNPVQDAAPSFAAKGPIDDTPKGLGLWTYWLHGGMWRMPGNTLTP